MRIQHLQLVPSLTKRYSYLTVQDSQLIHQAAIGSFGNHSPKLKEGTHLAKPLPIEFNQQIGTEIPTKVTSQNPILTSGNEVGKPSKVQELIHKLWTVFLRRGENIKISSIDISREKNRNIDHMKFSKVETIIENIQMMAKKIEGLKKRYETLKSLRDQIRHYITLCEGSWTNDQVANIQQANETANTSFKFDKSSMHMEILKFVLDYMENAPEEPGNLSEA